MPKTIAIHGDKGTAIIEQEDILRWELTPPIPEEGLVILEGDNQRVSENSDFTLTVRASRDLLPHALLRQVQAGHRDHGLGLDPAVEARADDRMRDERIAKPRLPARCRHAAGGKPKARENARLKAAGFEAQLAAWSEADLLVSGWNDAPARAHLDGMDIHRAGRRYTFSIAAKRRQNAAGRTRPPTASCR